MSETSRGHESRAASKRGMAWHGPGSTAGDAEASGKLSLRQLLHTLVEYN